MPICQVCQTDQPISNMRLTPTNHPTSIILLSCLARHQIDVDSASRIYKQWSSKRQRFCTAHVLEAVSKHIRYKFAWNLDIVILGQLAAKNLFPKRKLWELFKTLFLGRELQQLLGEFPLDGLIGIPDSVMEDFMAHVRMYGTLLGVSGIQNR